MQNASCKVRVGFERFAIAAAPRGSHARVRPLLHARLVQLLRRLAVHAELLQHLRRVRTHRRHRPGWLRGLSAEVDRGGDARDLLDTLLQVLLNAFDLERSEAGAEEVCEDEADYGG
eukprot:COSAG04_NODE_7277_length_1155_cov_1.254735_1_plen_117_part_00